MLLSQSRDVTSGPSLMKAMMKSYTPLKHSFKETQGGTQMP